eukprot:TCONS_00034479-protein
MADAPPPLAIREANVHLQALHERNIALEKEVKELRNLLPVSQEQEGRLKGQQQIIKEKDERIKNLETELTNTLRDKCQQIAQLEEKLNEYAKEVAKKDLQINQMTRKVKTLNDIAKHKSVLERVVKSLGELEENFIVDVDNMIQVTSEDSAIEVVDVNKLKELDLETSL